MNADRNNKKLDELIFKTVGREKPTFDFDKWKQAHKEEIQIYKSQTSDEKTSRSVRIFKIGRTIMKSPITKTAAAAVIIIAVIMILHNGSVDIASVTWGDVQEAFLAQSWVHVIYDNGREEWMNIQEGKHFYISEFGWRFFDDRTSHTRFDYSPKSNKILEVKSKSYPEGEVPPWEPRIAWEVILGFLGEGESRAMGLYTDIERHFDTVDGRNAMRFDIYYVGALGNRDLASQILADPETRLPIRIRSRLTLGIRERYGVEYITGEYDFPDTGPESIFDLGAPSNLKIVSRVESVDTISAEVQQILQAGEKAAQEFPKRYRAIVWQGQEHGTIQVKYRNKDSLHSLNYFNLDGQKYPDCHIDIPATTAAILAWTTNQMPVGVGVYNDGIIYRRYNVHPYHDVNKQTKVEVHRASTYPIPGFFCLDDDFWPYFYSKNKSLKIITYHSETPPGCVALSNRNAYYFVDPLKDYISVKTIYIRNVDGQEIKNSETSLSNFIQLPTGHWYPQKRSIHFYDNHLFRRELPPELPENIDIQLLQEDEFPIDTFNGEKLLEGAKIETY